MTPVHLPASKKLVREAGVEPAASRLSIECSNRAELFPVGARGGNRNPGLRITSAALFHLSYSGMERVRRIELRYSDRRSDAQPIGHTRTNSGADGDNRNLFSGLEAQGTPYIPRPLTQTSCDAYSVVKDLALRHTSTSSLPAGSKLDEMPQIADKTKKEGCHFWWPPSS